MVECNLDMVEAVGPIPASLTKYHYKIVKIAPQDYILIEFKEAAIRGFISHFRGTKQECIDMYNENFERSFEGHSYSTLEVTRT